MIVPDADPPGSDLQHIIVGVEYLEGRRARLEFNYDEILLASLENTPIRSLEIR